MKVVYDVSAEVFVGLAESALLENWQYSDINRDNFDLKVDVDGYRRLQEVGLLRNVCLVEDEEIIGYSVFTIGPHLHYAGKKIASVDVIFLKEEYRKGESGIRLIKLTENLCREEGADMITYHTNPECPGIESILGRMKYKHMESTFGKVLGD